MRARLVLMGSTENHLKLGMMSAGLGKVTSAVSDRHTISANNNENSIRSGIAIEPPGEVPLSDDSYDESIVHKTILVGDSGVGKTSLLVQFDQKKFQPGSFAATVGIGFTNKVVTVDEAKVKLQIWDTAGQERFRSITHAYYRDAHALLLLYDVMNKKSFDNISAWLAEINEYAHDDVVIMLIGNKADADASGKRAVKKEEGIGVAKDYGVRFMETSAMTGQNVELAFMSIARDLKMKKLRRQTDDNLQLTLHDSSNQPSEQGTKQSATGRTTFGCC